MTEPTFTLADANKLVDQFYAAMQKQNHTDPAIRLFELEFRQRLWKIGEMLSMEQGFSSPEGMREKYEAMGKKGEEEMLGLPLGLDAHIAFMELCEWLKTELHLATTPLS